MSNRRALYGAFVLILALGLRKGEVPGLTWEVFDRHAAELYCRNRRRVPCPASRDEFCGVRRS